MRYLESTAPKQRATQGRKGIDGLGGEGTRNSDLPFARAFLHLINFEGRTGADINADQCFTCFILVGRSVRWKFRVVEVPFR